MDDIFRGFFGIRRPRIDGHPSHDEDQDESQSSGIDDFCRPRHGGLDDMFKHFHHDMFQQMESLHREIEDMMRGFGTIDFPSVFEPPAEDNHDDLNKDKSNNQTFFWPSPSPFFRQSSSSQSQSPRDFMLKDGTDEFTGSVDSLQKIKPKSEDKVFNIPSFETPRKERKEDSDLDGKVSDEKMLDLIKRHDGSQRKEQSHLNAAAESPQNFFSSQSVSVSTVMSPDGKVEQKRIVRDSTGREESTIKRSVGGRSHTVTTITDDKGNQEKHEKIDNMDRSDLSKFDDLWSKGKGESLTSSGNSILMPQAPSSLPLDPSDQGLFFRLFGRGSR